MEPITHRGAAHGDLVGRQGKYRAAGQWGLGIAADQDEGAVLLPCLTGFIFGPNLPIWPHTMLL
jgi:hypothetical protein